MCVLLTIIRKINHALTNVSEITDSSSKENVSRKEMKTSAFGKSSKKIHALFNIFVGIEKNDQKLEGIEKKGKDSNLRKNLPEDDAFMETDEVEPEGKSYSSGEKKTCA